MSRAVIGVDLGGTNMRTALLNHDGDVLERTREKTPVAEGYRQVIEKLSECIERQRCRARDRGMEVAAIGVGAPGVIHAAQGIVLTSPNFPDWKNVPLKQLLEQKLHIPVYVENDANAAALGEQWRGAGKGIDSMILLTLGTGVGGGIILEGRIWRGADGTAGEVGHMTILPEGRTCGCGNRGCLEMYASARGIVMSYHDRKAVLGLPGPDASVTAESVFREAQAGGDVALSVMGEMGRFLGIGIANLINIFNPEMIVIGGGVKEAWSLFIDAAVREIKARAFAYPAERTRIVPSVLGDDAGMIGAGSVALGS